MKFKAGDRFKVRDYDVYVDESSGGIITAVSYNSNTGEYEYVVQWDHFKKEYTYSCDACDQMWEYDNDPAPVYYEYGKSNSVPVSSGVSGDCVHIWKTYNGFSNSFDYCEKCDKKRSE